MRTGPAENSFQDATMKVLIILLPFTLDNLVPFCNPATLSLGNDSTLRHSSLRRGSDDLYKMWQPY